MEIILLFILGISIGSFLNVLVDRLPKNESIIKSRSHCDHCRRKLAWYDLIPVFSFIMLSGKCRHCRSPISFYSPTIELTTGILFVMLFLLIQDISIMYQVLSIRYIAQIFFYLFLVSSLIVIFFTDLKYGIIPNKIVYSAIIVSSIYLILNTNYLILSNFFSAFFVFLFFILIFFATHGKGMGFGDVKLVFLLGLILGFPKIALAIYLAFLIGAIVSIILILFKKKKFFGSTIPFGPFLVLATIIALFWGSIIIEKILPFLIG